jgi:hypothetical protein
MPKASRLFCDNGDVNMCLSVLLTIMQYEGDIYLCFFTMCERDQLNFSNLRQT